MPGATLSRLESIKKSRSRPKRWGLVSLILVIAALPTDAEVFEVTDLIDAIPAPVGSLRWAIEQSEQNGRPDRIAFIIDGGTIELVAPLPSLLEGNLTIGERGPTLQPVAGNGIAISGVDQIVRAIAIHSANNVIGELDFIRFAGNEAILIGGGKARDNILDGLGFGRDSILDGNTGAGVRILADNGDPGMPTRTRIRSSRFVNNGAGVVIEGQPSAASLQQHWTLIWNNWFGTDGSGGPGPGTGTAVQASNAGEVRVSSNRFSGPGANGILIGNGSGGSSIVGNRVGLGGADGIACSGFSGAGIVVEGAVGVEISDNVVRCNDDGVLLSSGADEARILGNRIGGSIDERNRAHGILIDSADGALIRLNEIVRNDGYGVASGPGPAVDPGNRTVLACNSIHANSLGALGLADVVAVPPVLTTATPIAVFGDLLDPAPGWIEVFGDNAEQARVFQGSLRVSDLSPPFRHRLPVLGLQVGKTSSGTEISFDREVPDNHTATHSDEADHETTELSDALPAEKTGLVFDLIRGRISNLALSADGINLGPVICLDSGMDPDTTISPDVLDVDTPPIGEGFFYVSRRRNAVEAAPGTYDPAICLTDVDAFDGPRRPDSGDCPP